MLAGPFLYAGYVFVNQAVTGGVTDRGEYVEVDLKSLGYFPFDAVKDTIDTVPARFRKLDGRRVVLEGEMYAPGAASNHIKDFQLVYSIQDCCFSGPPKVQERVFAAGKNGKKLPYYGGVVRVVGTLRVEVKKDLGTATSVYTMDVESIEPV